MTKFIFSAILLLGLSAQAIPAKTKILCTPAYGSKGTYTVAVDAAAADDNRLVLVAYESVTPAGDAGLMSQFLKLKAQLQGSALIFATADHRFVLSIGLESLIPRKEGEPYFANLSSDLDTTHVDEQMGCLFYN